MPPASPQKGVPDRSTVTWYVFDMIRAAGFPSAGIIGRVEAGAPKITVI